jgi:ubiquinone/menaquinone biosynthesis C-methylase UbiE
MEPRQAYDQWSEQYDTNINRTRDLEKVALRHTLAGRTFNHCLELGCGTGKNTEWLLSIADHITAIDLSAGMLGKAREKITSPRVQFQQGNMLEAWDTDRTFDLVVCSLVLEHVEHLPPLFEKVAASLRPGGSLYIGELHPFRQYSGSKARFPTPDGEQVVACFSHHISDFTTAAKSAGLLIGDIVEMFDDGDRTGLPRTISMLFTK